MAQLDGYKTRGCLLFGSKGVGKITLYKEKEVVQRNIEEKEAALGFAISRNKCT